MLKSFKGIREESDCVIVIEKSKFICFAIPVFSKDKIDATLNKFRKEYSDATHICYAYTLTENGVYEKYSDDGEPAGTAGYPICMVIKKRNLTNVLVVVVRYFGGKKLGAGGLVRAYTLCASSALDKAGEYEYNIAKKISVSFNVSEYFKYAGILNSSMVKGKKEIFDDELCHVEIDISESDYEKFVSLLRLINTETEIRYSEIYL